jgi:PAS domain S-box-containing protein
MLTEILKLQELTHQLLEKDKLLKQSQEHCSFLIDTIPDVVYTTNEEGIIDFISDKILAFGYSISDIIGQEFLNIVYEEDKFFVKKEISNLIKKQTSKIKIEFRLKTLDKSIVWISDHISLVYNEKGVVIKSVGVFRDITKRRQLEQLTYDKYLLLKTITDNMESFIWIKDLNNKYLFINNNLEKLFKELQITNVIGFSDKELNSKYPTTYSTGKFLEISDELTKKEIKTCRFYEVLKPSIEKEIWIDVKKSPLINNGKLLGLVGVAFNITTDKEDIKKGIEKRIDKQLIKVIVKEYVYQLERV